MHWWHPISETGLKTNMSDDLLWLPFLVIHYIKETNDYTILDEKVEYYDDKENLEPILNHSIKAIDKVLSRVSERGLPLIGAGDWNDGLSAVGLEWKGESIWLTEFLYLILNEFIEILNKLNYFKTNEYLTRANKLKEAFEKHAWDGEWFYRATKDNGEKIGSNDSEEGKIYLNPQTWAVISNIANKEKQNIALNSTEKYLIKKNGPVLLYPAYSKPDYLIGYLSRYAPGRRENGGVYTHAATWSIWAFSLIKKKELVYEIYKKLSPVLNGLNPDEYMVEPYVTPGNIEGPDSPLYGMGGWTWYTGSAAWLQKVIVEYLIGVRAEKNGLLLDPNFPDDWDYVRFIPVVTTLVAVAIVWRYIYHPKFGLFNYILSFFGIDPIDWLGDPVFAMPAIIILTVWKNFGYNMILFIAGLQNIPKDLYEAADLDGASSWFKFKSITLPLLAPTTFFISIMTMIGYFQLFAEPYVMTQGGPLNATLSIVLYMYQEGFRWWNIGYSVSIAFVLFVIILIGTLIQFRYEKRIHY